MGKRSEFPRRERDTYDTPYSAVIPLLPHLKPNTRFAELCAGKGDLIRHLEQHGHKCTEAWDIEPRAEGINKGDALQLVTGGMDCIITNTPWDRELLHPMIDHFRMMAPTWILLDADWMHTKQAAPYLPYCAKIVAVGRVKWIEGSKHTGKDNAVWMRFEDDYTETLFVGRV